MPRKPLELDELVPEPVREPELTGEGWDVYATVYARIPAPLYEKLRKRAWEMTKGRKRVTQQDVLIAALRQYLGQ